MKVRQHVEDSNDRKLRNTEKSRLKQVVETMADVNVRECICDAYFQECQQNIDDSCELNRQISCKKNATKVVSVTCDDRDMSSTFRGGGLSQVSNGTNIDTGQTSTTSSSRKSLMVKGDTRSCHSTCRSERPHEPAIEDCVKSKLSSTSSVHHQPTKLQTRAVFRLQSLNLSGCFQVTDVGLR